MGDAIMATSQVRELHKNSGRQIVVCDQYGRVRYVPDVFANNPRISQVVTPHTVKLINAAGARPYISGKGPERWRFQRWDIQPGEIFLSEHEQKWAMQWRGSILVEPNTKVPNGNKSWPFERWQEVVTRVAYPYIQVGAPGVQRLNGVEYYESSFRQALAILSVCRGFVGTEGALHHAAAAFGVPAVVLWSEFISPEYTGYATQTNLRHAEGYCGSRLPCNGCRASMAAITVDEVVAAMRAKFG